MNLVLTDEHYMRRAVRLALRGRFQTRPNPMVGALVVKNGRILGRGFHQYTGGPHAEVNALHAAGASAADATLYVTLEPCNHQGKTPPCTRAVLEAGISRVVIGALDPNPNVAGQGAEFLRCKGLEVKTGVLEEEAREINADWEYWIKSGQPALSFQLLQSPDGRLRELSTGDSIAGAHRRRCLRRTQAALIELSFISRAAAQLRSTVPGKLYVLDWDKQLLKKSNEVSTLLGLAAQVTLITGGPVKSDYVTPIREHGGAVIEVSAGEGEDELAAVLKSLATEGLQSLSVFGDAEFLRKLLTEDCCRRIVVYFQPALGAESSGSAGCELNGPPEVELFLRKAAKLGQEALGVYQVVSRGEPR